MADTVDTNALTSLDSASRHMSLKSSKNDLLIINLINQVSAKIEHIAGRNFKARDYRLWLNATPSSAIVLPDYPVIYTDRIATGCQDVLDVAYSGAAIRATVQVYRDETGQTGGIRLISYDTSGSKTATLLTAALNGSTSAMATAITAVSGWTGTSLVNVPSSDLHPTGGVDADDKTITLTAPDDDDNVYRVDHEPGIIRLDRAIRAGYTGEGLGSILVECRLGYETIPADIELIANEMVKQAFEVRNQNVSLSSESIGDYSYSLVDQVAINDGVMSKLQRYKRISMGGVA